MKIHVSLFDSVQARSIEVRRLTLPEITELIEGTRATEKAHLPLLKLAMFGDYRTRKGSLRCDRNMHFIGGVELDYDGGKMSFEDAVTVAEKQPLQCLLYTSPSHSPERPRWRLLAPTSREYPAADRKRFVERINGAYDGIFSSESWTASQSFFFGRLTTNPHFQIVLVDGELVDDLHDLDLITRGKAAIGPNGSSNGHGFEGGTAGLTEAQLAALIRSGEHYHEPTLRLATIWARHGVDQSQAEEDLEDLFDEVPAEQQDRERWKPRRAEVHRCVADMYLNVAREADEAEERRAAGLADLEARAGNGLDPDPGAGGDLPPPPPSDDPGEGAGDAGDPGARKRIPPPPPPGEAGRQRRQCPPAVGRETVFTRKANWRAGLLKSAKGQIRACLANAILALRHAPEWEDRLWFDMFHNRAVLRGVPPWSSKTFDDEPWSDLFDNLTTDWLQHHGIFVSHEITGRAVWTVARDQWFHPVRQYLERCRCSWDGEKRVFNWPTTYLGTPHDAYSSAVGQRWLISLVARVMAPGCKANSSLVLEGPQGIFKSEVLRRLGWPWVTDDMGGAPLGSKDAAVQVAGVWVMELAELDQHTTGRDVARPNPS